jgi:hypothetical protein
MKRLSKEFLVAKKNAQETFLRSVLQNEGGCWTEFYKYVKGHKGNRENIPVIKDLNGKLITHTTEKANSLNSYYASLFSCECNIPQIQSTDSGKPFTISINIIRKRLSTIGKKKCQTRWHTWGNFKVRRGSHDSLPREIAGYYKEKYNAIPGDWKKPIVVPI